MTNSLSEDIQSEPIDSRACSTCHFWRKQTIRDESDWGQCRRMPPILPEMADDKLVIAGIWPSTKSEDWCGEWESCMSTRTDIPQP
ncbi:MAG: hypothetical protein HOD99_04165 [Planctomycetaceae bacterium]|jgi:hypothetical protein|nr:hypothetical protein [Planctomycetaceae bacterium]MBT4158008.1 hypothetical protein [Planctomycetaceae bacterium]